jgi:hypothetical protein
LNFDTQKLTNITLPSWFSQPEYDGVNNRLIGLSKNSVGQLEVRFPSNPFLISNSQVTSVDLSTFEMNFVATIPTGALPAFTATSYSPSSNLFAVCVLSIMTGEGALVVVNVETQDVIASTPWTESVLIYTLFFAS